MVQLNAILARAKEYNLTFEEVVPGSDGILSRPIRMDFTAGDYQTVRAIVDDLYHCWYRCSIEDLTVTAEKNLNTPGSVTAQLSVIFYEKMPTDE